ncbi:MAG: sodium/solute symporter [Clostridiaceae bacterium]|jgi:SSS family solute:Na+ symporter|nr:sodium/solute symporter [Clostridiaceae bacterium]
MLKYVFLSLFVIIMVGVGIFSRKKVNNVQDFFLGSRKMGPWLSAFAYGTTYFSAVIFIGYAGKTGWGFGISSTFIGIGNAVIGSLLAWLVLAKRTRRMTHELNVSTMPEFFEKRYNSKAMKIVTALIIFAFLVPYSASVYQGLGYLFEETFGIPYVYCMAVMAFLTGVYLLLGGYVATAINDFIQGIIMLVGIVLMVFFILSNPVVGGLRAGIQKLSEIPGDGPGLVSLFSSQPLNLIGLIILTSLGTWGLPQMVHKFYAIKDDAAVKRGTVISTVFALIIAGAAYFVGSFGRLYLNNTMPVGANGRPNPDMVMPIMLEKALPDALIGIVVILVLSASMSTLSSIVLVSSSAISMDLFQGALFPGMKKETVMSVMRGICGLFVVLSFLVAVTPNSILSLMSFSWGTISGAFLAPFIYGLYWKGTTKAGAWSGFISGFVVSIAGAVIYKMDAAAAPNIGAVAMLVSLIMVPLVSMLTASSRENQLDMAMPQLTKKVS